MTDYPVRVRTPDGWQDLVGPPGPKGDKGDTGNPGPAGGGHTIQDEGTSLPARAALSFAGVGVTATDDVSNDRTTVTIPGDRNYVHTQGTGATTWVVTHGLGKFPAVQVVDTGNTVLIPDVHYDDVSQVTLSFGAPVSGKAFVN